jgi:hypothetical protein
MSETTAPVELLAVSFGAHVRFEGRIADEIDQLERAGLIRVLDFLFLKRDRDSGALLRVDYDGEGLVPRLIEGDDPAGAPPGARHYLTPGEVRAVADALEPGASAAFLIFEHVWSRGLHRAIAEVGGEPLADGFLIPEVLAAASR